MRGELSNITHGEERSLDSLSPETRQQDDDGSLISDEVADDEQALLHSSVGMVMVMLQSVWRYFIVEPQEIERKRALKAENRANLQKLDNENDLGLQELFERVQGGAHDQKKSISVHDDDVPEPNLSLLDKPVPDFSTVVWNAAVVTYDKISSGASMVAQAILSPPDHHELEENEPDLTEINDFQEAASEVETEYNKVPATSEARPLSASVWQDFSGVMQYLWPTRNFYDVEERQANIPKNQQTVFRSVATVPEKPNGAIITTHHNEQADITHHDNHFDVIGSRTAVEDVIVNLYKIELAAQGKIELNDCGEVARIIDHDFKLSLDTHDITLANNQDEPLPSSKREDILRALDMKFAKEFKSHYIPSVPLVKTTNAPFAHSLNSRSQSAAVPTLSTHTLHPPVMRP